VIFSVQMLVVIQLSVANSQLYELNEVIDVAIL